ncbi:autotransporter-associated beta strand repeat-containing protein, partial [Accumulibacter sp.]|uniref:two-partner secretion domain-containing protein n=1 Tax=Accumulibacter sp. TaxID=2053492 RepID=UPI001ACAB2A6
MASKVNREQNRNHRAAPCRATLRPIVFALMAAFGSIAHGLPTDPKVIAGQATVSTSNPSSMVINQSSGKAAIDWRTFSVAGHESVRFAQPSASAMTVNRVTSNDPSQILGRISAPGSVFLINPAGVLFGKGAVVHVGNLVASTLNANPHDLLAGRLVFTADPAGAGVVRNEGQISTPAGGSVSLIGARVINSGHISTPGGTTGLIAGEKVAIDFDGDGLIRYQVDGAMARALVEHTGRIDADGGRVVMQARARDALLDTVLNVEGVVRARGVAVRNGEIHLDGGGSGVVSVSGQLDASTPDVARQGGEIRVLGDRVGLFGQARLDASGAAGGGTVLIGGDYQGQGSERNATQTYVGPEVTITADAGSTGDGGKVIVWADDWTRYHGTISAKGGEQGGDGGFVEVSGKRNLSFDGDVVTSAAKGRAGMLLLDPADLYFSSTAVGVELTAPPFAATGTGNFYVNPSRFTNDTDYTLSATQDFILNTDASFASTDGRTVSITATRSIKSDPSAGKDFSISTAGAALNLTAQSMTLGAVSTGVGAIGINVTGVGQSATQSGAFSGGSLTKQGAGSLQLSQANTYTNGTIIQEGTLTAGHAQALGGGLATVASGATLNIADNVVLSMASGLNLSGSGVSGAGALTGTGTAQYMGGVTLSADSHVGAATGAQLTLTGAITGPHALFKVGAGTVVLSSANSYTLGTTIQEGTLTAGDAKALGDGVATIYRGATLNIADGKTLSLPGGLVFDPQLAPGAGAGARGALTGTGTAQGGTGGVGGAITLEADAEVGGTGGTLTLTGAITGPHALFKVGAGTVVLSSANFYTLGTTIQEGTLTAGDAKALGDGVATIYRGATLNIADGKTLSLPGGLVFDTQLAPGAGAGARGALTGTGTAQYGDTVGVGGAITLNTDAEVGGTGGMLTLTGAITGAGRLYKVGAGTVVLGNAANDYSGGTTISDGTLKTSAASVLPDDEEVQVAAGLLDIQVHNQSVGKLLGAGNIELGTAATLTVRDGDFAGHISGAGKLSKTSTGSLILSSSSNYTGGTIIQEGTLTAGDAQALGGGLATVASGATLNIADKVVLSMASGLNLSGSGVSGAGALTGTGTAQYMGGVTLSADSHV